MTGLRRTPLFEVQRAAGGRIVPFAGWEMPVSFSGILEEHRAVRTSVGLFDVSHMGRYRLEGPRSGEVLDWLVTVRASAVESGQWLYTMLLDERGGVLDDLLVGWYGESFLAVVNASNREPDFARIAGRVAQAGGAALYDDSEKYAMLALQGPGSRDLLGRVTGADLNGIGYYRMAPGAWQGEELIISRTGYTGELGYEIYIRSGAAERFWTALREAGAFPCGLGARDTLRLEMGYPLYGHELDCGHTPLEAGLGWVVDFGKPDFCGREALLRQKEQGVKVLLRGIEAAGRDIPRAGYALFRDTREVGRLASGGIAPSTGKGIGTAYLPVELAAPGTALELDLRGRRAPVSVVKPPFYTQGTARS
jgi:aminomethyltransferase